jgi:hypothetical protein
VELILPSVIADNAVCVVVFADYFAFSDEVSSNEGELLASPATSSGRMSSRTASTCSIEEVEAVRLYPSCLATVFWETAFCPSIHASEGFPISAVLATIVVEYSNPIEAALA